MEMEDLQIIELFLNRDERAIGETKSKYGAYVRAVSYRILQNNEDADENENDTYLHAWNAIPPARPRFLSAFLAKIARNLAVSGLRAKRAEKRGGGEVFLSLEELNDCIPDSRRFEDDFEETHLASLLNAFLRSLSETERILFIRRYWRCDSVAELAKAFGCGESKVKMTLLRTRNKLRVYLEKEGVFVETE